MQITIIGHASIFVETQDCKILMDPVFWDPFCEGLNESCPKREVIPKKIPEFDFLVISHQHLDHFDIRTLAYLPKNVDVLIPQDKLLIESLHQLGYSRIYPLRDFNKVIIGSTTLMTTRSEVRVPEFGMIFADPSGVFWNTVDTYFAPPTIQKVKSDYPNIDFLLSVWHISMEGKYQYNQSISFPFQLYGELFNLISLVKPKAIAPGASGFKYINQSSWQNKVVFPVTRERFCYDLETAFPELKDKIFCLNPGDIFNLDQEKYHHLVGKAEYVKQIIDDREYLEFSPVNIDTNLIDSNPEKYEIELMKQTISEEIEVNLIPFIQKHKNSLFQEHIRWSVIYQLEVIFAHSSEKWHINFLEENDIKFKKGRTPLANFYSYITASNFYSLIQKKRGWDYLLCSGEYRKFHKVYAINDLGIIIPNNIDFKDPLELKYNSDYIAGNNIQNEIQELQNKKFAINESHQLDQDSNPMINLGNILIKKREKKS